MRQLPAVALSLLLIALAPFASATTADGVAAYEDGDFAAAVDFLRAPAEAGDLRAQFYLAKAFADAPPPTRDLEGAVDWFTAAADAGHAEAQFQLGMRYSVGLGTDRDLIEAYKWLRLSERELGTAAPSTFLQVFEHRMSAEDIATAEAAIDAWRPSGVDLAALPDTPPPAAPPNPVQPTATAVQRLAAAYDCADIDAQAGADGTLRVTGVLRDAVEVAALIDDLATAFAGSDLPTDLVPIGEPNCAVAALIGAHRPDYPMLTAPRSTFAAGDVIVADIAGGDATRHLYVDYFQLDGTVIHLVPEAVGGPALIPAGTSLRLGDGSTSGFVWRADQPFGRELLAVFMSDEPLFDGERPVDELTVDYLRRLRAQTSAHRGAVFADYLTITTGP